MLDCFNPYRAQSSSQTQPWPSYSSADVVVHFHRGPARHDLCHISMPLRSRLRCVAPDPRTVTLTHAVDIHNAVAVGYENNNLNRRRVTVYRKNRIKVYVCKLT